MPDNFRVGTNYFADSIVDVLAHCVVGEKQFEAEEYTIDDPVGRNLGYWFENDTFRIMDFCWCDGRIHPEGEDGIPTCPPNFEYFKTGAACEWYKHMGRSQYWNRELSDEECTQMLVDCLKSLGVV